MGCSMKRAIRSPSRVRTSQPTITVTPGTRASRALCAPSIRSWSVMARWVMPRVAAARTTASGLLSESKLALV